MVRTFRPGTTWKPPVKIPDPDDQHDWTGFDLWLEADRAAKKEADKKTNNARHKTADRSNAPLPNRWAWLEDLKGEQGEKESP